MDFSINIVLDTRRKKKNGTYPVKLRVWSAMLQKRKRYPTGLDLTEKEFEKCMQPNPKGKNFENRTYLNAKLNKANDTAKELEPFTFENFEDKLFAKKGDRKNVFFHYTQKIERLKENGQFSTAEVYELSRKSIRDYLTNGKGKKSVEKLSFYAITPDWLQGFENYMVNDKGRSLTTVSIYVRALRALFSEAVADKDINNDTDPFGKRKYRVPSQKRVKKAYSSDQLKALHNAEPKTPEQRKALDFWFFSYACKGMNIKDIALIKFKDIQGDRIVYYREKTKTTRKTNLKPTTVYLTPLSQSIIDKYGKESPQPDDFIFDIIEPDEHPDTQRVNIKKFTRYINQHIKKVAADNDLPTEISVQWARHSYATKYVRSGGTLEGVSEELGHSSVKVTEGYFAGFEDETKRQLAQTLTNF